MKGSNNGKISYKQKVSKIEIDAAVLSEIGKRKSAKWIGTLKIRRKFQPWKTAYIYMERWLSFRSLGKALSILKSKILKILDKHGLSSDFPIARSKGIDGGDMSNVYARDVNNSSVSAQDPSLVSSHSCGSELKGFISNGVRSILSEKNYMEDDYSNISIADNKGLYVQKSIVDAAFQESLRDKYGDDEGRGEIKPPLGKKKIRKAIKSVLAIKDIKEVWCYFVSQEGPYVALITINPRQRTSEKNAKQLVNTALRRLNKQLYGDSYRKNCKYVEGIAVPERHVKCFRLNELHYHILVRCPPGIDPSEFYAQLEKSFWSAVASMSGSKRLGKCIFNRTFHITDTYSQLEPISYVLKGLEKGGWSRKDEVEILTIDGIP